MPPVLSLVVVVYDMPEPARRTLLSLCPPYQRGVQPDAYEVIVVENVSSRLLGSEAARAAAPNVRYFLREESTRSPGPAVNFGVSQARGRMVGVLVDGARLLSPGVVRLALMAERMTSRAILSVPGYHLGREIQQEAVAAGYDEAEEARLLSSITWPQDGYRLFDVACFSGSCAGGFFRPFSESNCLCLPTSLFESVGGMDPAFVSPGGGYVNLDFYERATAAADTTLFLTPGEGTFHQFHGGISTGGVRGDERARLMEGFVSEYRRLRGKEYVVPARQALLLGEVPPQARRFVQRSAVLWSEAGR